MKQANVTDADREAAANYADADGEYFVDPEDRREFIAKTLASELDEEPLVQAFANHRTQSVAALQAKNEKLREAIDGIYQYANDTLSGRVDGPDDRDWQRAAVVECRNRARPFSSMPAAVFAQKEIERKAALSDGEG